MNNLDPLARQKIIVSLARLQPASVVRLSMTSRAMRNETENKRKQLNALKRLVRRRVARMRHFESPIHPGGHRGRLSSPLYHARLIAHAYARMTPTRISGQKIRRLLHGAKKAYIDYTRHTTNAMWGRFVRIHAKRPGHTAAITRQQARNMYNN